MQRFRAADHDAARPRRSGNFGPAGRAGSPRPPRGALVLGSLGSALAAFVLASAPLGAAAEPARILLVADETAPPVKAGSLVIDRAWARATPAGASVAAGYLRITNDGKEADRLMGGEAPFAGRVEVHQMSMVNNVMHMRQLTEGLEIKPGQSVELKPGGYHLMFVGVKGRLLQGSHVKATLQFEKAGKVEVDFDVQPIGAMAPPAAQHVH